MGAIDKTSLDRLVALGRKSGRLTTENLRDVLPIETMSADERRLKAWLKSMELTGVAIRSGRADIWTAWVSCTNISM